MTEELALKITNKISFASKNDCWKWLGAGDLDGYPLITHKGKTSRVARLIMKARDTKIFVCHTCDNPNCLNPAHLFLGTHKENMEDCVKKGRNRGPRKTHCKYGHEYTEKNSYWHRSKTGINRRCLACKRKQEMLLQRKRRAK